MHTLTTLTCAIFLSFFAEVYKSIINYHTCPIFYNSVYDNQISSERVEQFIRRQTILVHLYRILLSELNKGFEYDSKFKARGVLTKEEFPTPK